MFEREHGQSGLLTITGPITKERVRVDENVDDGTGTGEDDWYCLTIASTRCSCGQLMRHITIQHMIIVWPDKDDPHILYWAKKMTEAEKHPRVRAYEESMGPCISYYTYVSRQLQPCS